MSTQTFKLEDVNLARMVLGERDAHIEQLEKIFGVEILARGTTVTLKGKADQIQLVARVMNELYALAGRGYPVSPTDVDQAARVIKDNPGAVLADIFLDSITLSTRNRFITPKTLTQKTYVDAIRKQDIVFGWGPAGTGKTYLAMAMAVQALVNREVNHIILTRPAVEAGEKLGFLPGDLAEKVNPYLRPLYDALHDMMELEKAAKLVENGVIEVAPLAFMRGRTLNQAFVILDEAQNTTSEQMKMFLTRLGSDSKAVVTGDITQIDLPGRALSGLVEALDLLRKIPGIGFVEFTEKDIVRHPLVQKIVEAYESAAKFRG